MQSFLSKVFGRKKDDRDGSPTQLSPGELLGERFEAISPNVSPSAAKFLELDPKPNSAGESSKDPGFSLFRPKSRPSSPETKSKRHDTLPQLSLAFLETNGPLSPAADFVREADPDISVLLSDAIIGQRKLNPLEALVLIRACSQAIIARGLETLGVMHPHWYSASPDVQRRLISQFINSLNAESTTSPASSSPTTAFESEMTFTRPHDVAAVLRWGLRHLQLDGDHLGKDDTWYTKFLEAEATADYPLKAFSEQLAPHLPPAHLEVLTSTLEIFSSLAAHAEANSTSGSKLSKIFGLWLLVSQRVDSKDDFHAFYQRWERMGRMLEHLFLARIRDDSADRRMPVRLLELVRQYPYTKGLSNPMTDAKLLARPRITTIPYDALFVRLEVELPSEKRRPKHKINPLTLLADAFSLQIEGEHAELWSIITSESKHGSSPSPLSNVFADETIRFLSMVPGTDGGEVPVKSPTFSIFAGGVLSPHKRSATAIEKGKGKLAPTVVSGHVKPATDPTPVSALSPLDLTQDWDQFSTSGFFEVSPAIVPLASTLFDNDVEKTIPPDPPVAVSLSRSISRRSSKSRRSRHAKSPSTTSPRKSEETIRPTPAEGSSVALAPSPPQQDTLPLTKATQVQIIQIDEAFVDFWSDALLDPISSDWPTFIICKFKSSLLPKLVIGLPQEGQTAKTLKWLILEHVHTVKPPLPPAPVEVARPRASSPSSESMSPKKRFSFWSMNRSLSGSSVGSQKGKNKAKSPVAVGEMGELLEEGSSGSSSSKSPISRIRKSLDISRKPAESPTLKKAESMTVIKEAAPVALAAGVAVAGVAAVVTLNEESKDDNQPPVAQETLEEAKPEDFAERGPTPSDAEPVPTQDEDAVVTVSSDAVIEQTTEIQLGVEAPTVSEPLPEVSGDSQVADKDGGVVNDFGASVIITETSQPAQVQEQDGTVAEVESAVHEDVVESPAHSVEAQNAPDLEQESSAEIAPQEAIQLEAEAAEQPEPDSHNTILEEHQVEATQDNKQPSVTHEEAQEIPSAEHVVPSNHEEAAAAHNEQSFSASLLDSAVAQVMEEQAEETAASPDVIPVDDGLKVDTVERNVESSHEHDGTSPIEEHGAVADVTVTEQLAVAASDESTPPRSLEDQADAVIPAETSIEAEGPVPSVASEVEAIAAQQSVEEKEIITEQPSAETETQVVTHTDVAATPQESELDPTSAGQPEELSALEKVTQPKGAEAREPVDDAKIVNEQELFDQVTPAKDVEGPPDTQSEPTEHIQITSEENKADDQPNSIAETVEERKPLVVEGESAPLETDDAPSLGHDDIVDSMQATADSVPELPEETSQPQIEETQQVITADAYIPADSAELALASNVDTEAVVETEDADTGPAITQDLPAEPASDAAPQVDAVQQSAATEQDSLVTEQPEEANTVNKPEAALVQDAEIVTAANNAELTNEEHLGAASEGNDAPEDVSPESSRNIEHSLDEQPADIVPAIETTENVVASSSEVHDDNLSTEKDADTLADTSGTSADVALGEPTPAGAEIQEASVVDHETPINVIQEVDGAEIEGVNEPSSIEATTEVSAETLPSEQPQESSDVGILEKVQVESDVDDSKSTPAPVTVLDEVQNDSIEQIMSPPLQKENADDHEYVSPSVPNTEPAVAATLNETTPSLEDVLPHDELGADAVADITAPSSEGIVGGTSVDEDETVVGEEATQAQPVESSASTTLEETPQQQVVAQEDTGADNETEVAEAAVVDSTEQGETLPETALPEDGAQESHQTSATPEVLEKHEDQGGVTTSQDDQTESVHGQPPNEPSPKESKSDDLVEQIAMLQTAEPEPVPHNNQLELSDTSPGIKPVINEQLTTEDQGIAEVNADSTNEPVGNVSVLSGAIDESSHSEGEEIGEAVDPIESPVSAAVDEPTPQIPEQEEAVIDEASNEVVASESTPVDGADEIEGTSELQQTEGGDLVAQGSSAEPTIEDDSEAATPQPHQSPEQDKAHDEQHEEAIAVDSEDHTELANIEEEISPATATDNNEDTLNSPGAPEDVQIQDTLPAEFKDESQSQIIPDTVDETKPPVEEESAPTHSNIFPEPKHDTTSQLTQDTTTEPTASVPSDEIPQDRIQEVKQDTAADKETSDDVAASSATPIAATTSVTEAQQADAPQPSAEPATEGSPQADAEQELPEESDQGVPPIEQPEASGADIAEDPQAESTETHGPTGDAVSVAEPPSVAVVTEHVEAALDAQESSEEVQHIETSTDEKDEDTTYSTVISETLDKVKPAIEEESTPDQNDQADILSELEPEHVPVEGDSPSSAVGLVGGVEDTLPTPEQNEDAETAASTLSDEVKEETGLKEETKPKEGAKVKEETEVKETELKEETEIKEETEPPVTSEASAIEEQSVAVHNIVPVPEREELVEFTPAIPEASPAVEEVPQPTIQAPKDADLDEPATSGQVEADDASDVHKASEEQVLQSETTPQLESSEQQDVNNGNDSQAEIIQDAIEPDQSAVPTNQPSEPDVEGQSVQVKVNQEVLPTVAPLSEAAEGLASSIQQLNHEEEQPETSTDDEAANGSRSDPNVTAKADTEDVSSLTAAVEEVPDSKSSVDIPVSSDEVLNQPTITQAVEEEEAAPNSAEVLAEVPIKGESDVLDQEPRDTVEDKNHDENAGSTRDEGPIQTNRDMPAEPVPAPFDASQEPLPGPVESLRIKSEGDAETPTIAAGHPILAEEPVGANDGVEDSSAIDNTAADPATPSLDEVPEAFVTVLEMQEMKGNTDTDVLQTLVQIQQGISEEAKLEGDSSKGIAEP